MLAKRVSAVRSETIARQPGFRGRDAANLSQLPPGMERTSVADSSIEWRYLGLVQLATGLSGVASWDALARAVGDALRTMEASAAVRIWGTTPDGIGELGHDPVDAVLRPLSQRVLRAAAE